MKAVIEPEKKGFFRRWVEYRRENRLKKIEKGMHWNPNVFFITIVALACVFVIALCVYAAIFIHTLGGTLQSFGDNIDHAAVKAGDIIQENPAVGMALLQQKPEVIFATLAAQTSAGTKVEGKFTSHFTTTTSRSLEKVDLTCIDKFSYVDLDANASRNIVEKQRLLDDGCAVYASEPAKTKEVLIPGAKEGEPTSVQHEQVAPAVDHYKCPMRNCELREKQEVLPDTIIPERLDVTSVQAKFDGRKGVTL